MIIEPTSVHSRSPIRRALRVVGLVTPALLLAVVAGVGLAGPKPSPSPELPSLALIASPAASSGAAPPSPAAGRPPSDPAAARLAFPTQFRTIPARRPSEVLAARAAGQPPEVAVVAGYLGITWLDLTCKDAPLGAAGPWCERRGTISDSPIATLGNPGPGGRPPHLQVTFPVGVRVPDAVAATEGQAAGSTVPAVVVGRFAPSSSCSGDPQACDQGFVVDRVVWANGIDDALTPLIEPRLDSGPRADPFVVAARLDAVPLVAVLAWPNAIASLDAEAGAAAAKGAASEPVWFVRMIVGIGGGVGTGLGPGVRTDSPRVAWLLLDEPRLRVIASGPALDPTGAGTAAMPLAGG
jgi:hypothetical protein